MPRAPATPPIRTSCPRAGRWNSSQGLSRVRHRYRGAPAAAGVFLAESAGALSAPASVSCGSPLSAAPGELLLQGPLRSCRGGGRSRSPSRERSAAVGRDKRRPDTRALLAPRLFCPLLFSSPSYTHRPFARGRCVGRGSGAGGRIPTNSFVWREFQIDSRAPNQTPQNGPLNPHRTNDQVPRPRPPSRLTLHMQAPKPENGWGVGPGGRCSTSGLGVWVGKGVFMCRVGGRGGLAIFG